MQHSVNFSVVKQLLSGGQGVMSEAIQKRLNDVESVAKYDSLSFCRNRKVGTHSNSYLNKHAPAESLLSTSEKSILPAAEDADAWLAPGTIVWVKDIRDSWWPAEVMDKRVLKEDDYQHTAQVLVQFFEIGERKANLLLLFSIFETSKANFIAFNLETNILYLIFCSICRAWVDASDLLQFPIYFEERSKNPSEAFQDALKQALSKYGNESLLRTSQDRCTDGMRSPTQPDKSPDASKTSISSSTKDDHDEEEGRGKRKRKTKIHFDEMAVADNPARKIRRLKIMRQLGLAAPIGSPFSPTHKSF